jgi:hypothetical protein
MADSKLRSFPVVDAEGSLVGILNIEDLLEARSKAHLRDSARERVISLRWPFGDQDHSTDLEQIAQNVAPTPPASASDEAALRKAAEKIEQGLD